MKRKMFFLITICLYFSACDFRLAASGLDAKAAELYKQAEDAYKAKDLEKASGLLFAALKIEPDNAVYRYILGRVLFESSDFLAAKEAFEIVSRSRPSPDKGGEYNERLKNYKRRVRTMQDTFNAQGQDKYSVYLKNQNSSQKVKLGITLYQAFRLNPPLRYKNFEKLTQATEIYEEALQASITGKDWKKEPMLQLAFLYEIANKKDKAAEVYMRALDYVEDPNEEYVITHKFDYLNRSNKEKLLDTIEAGEFTQKDLEELMGEASADISEDEKQEISDMIADVRSKLEDAATDEAREAVLETVKKAVMEKQKSGKLPGQEKLKKKLEKEGKTMEEYLKEQGLE